MKKIAVSELQAGDILLYHDHSFLARMICLFDGSDYHHASIYDGQHVVEAKGGVGVIVDSIEHSTEPEEYVDVFRFHCNTGEILGNAECPANPVLNKVVHYVEQGDRYAYEQIVLLALLTVSRKLPIVGWVPGLGVLLRQIFDSAMGVLNDMIAAQKEPMICSELVYRCYSEAGDIYVPKIVGADILKQGSLCDLMAMGMIPSMMSPEGDRELQDLLAAADSFLWKYASAKGKVMRTEAFQRKAVSDFVTPRDLRFSPNFEYVGRFF